MYILLVVLINAASIVFQLYQAPTCVFWNPEAAGMTYIIQIIIIRVILYDSFDQVDRVIGARKAAHSGKRRKTGSPVNVTISVLLVYLW